MKMQENLEKSKLSSMKATQISAPVSEDTKRMLDEFVRVSGQKKSFVIESALRHHMHALQELPADVIIPPRLVVTRASGDAILERLNGTPPRNSKLRALLRGDRR